MMSVTAKWRGARSALALAAVLSSLLAGAARAADASEADKLREQLRSTVLQLRELQDQQAAAKTGATPAPAPMATSGPDAAALKARLAAAQARLRSVTRDAADAAAAHADATKAKADLAALQESASATQAELEKYKAAFSQAADQSRALTAERDRLKSQLETQTTIAQACQAKNDRLTTFAEGLLDKYNHITLRDTLLASEPALGFTRVHLENIAQDREDTIRAARCDPRLDALPPRPATK